MLFDSIFEVIVICFVFDFGCPTLLATFTVHTVLMYVIQAVDCPSAIGAHWCSCSWSSPTIWIDNVILICLLLSMATHEDLNQVFPVFAGLLSRRPVSKSYFILLASSLLPRAGCSRVYYFLVPPSPTRSSINVATHHYLMDSLLSRRERSATVAAFTESLVSAGGRHGRNAVT